MTETQMTDEEFMQFVIENKERIIELMKTVDSTSDNDLKDYVKNTERKVKDRAHQAKDKTEDFAKDMYSAVMNPDVHKHFIRMGMEFFMGNNWSLAATFNNLLSYTLENANPKSGSSYRSSEFNFRVNPMEMDYAPLKLTLSYHF